MKINLDFLKQEILEKPTYISYIDNKTGFAIMDMLEILKSVRKIAVDVADLTK